MHARSTTQGFGQPMPLAALDSARRFLPARWLSELLVLALAAILLGSAALYAVAVLSTRVTMPTSSIADGWLRSDYDDPLLCLEHGDGARGRLCARSAS